MHLQELLVRCPEVGVEFLPAVLGALPLSVYRPSPSSGAEPSPSPDADMDTMSPSVLTGGGSDATGGSDLVPDDQEGVLGLLRFLQAQTEKHSYPTSLLEGSTADSPRPTAYTYISLYSSISISSSSSSSNPTRPSLNSSHS